MVDAEDMKTPDEEVAALRKANPISDQPSGSDVEHRKTKIRTGVDVPELSGSENSRAAFAPEMEQALLKNQEALSKRASSEAASGRTVLDLVVPRTVFMFKKLKPKKLIKWSSVQIISYQTFSLISFWCRNLCDFLYHRSTKMPPSWP